MGLVKAGQEFRHVELLGECLGAGTTGEVGLPGCCEGLEANHPREAKACGSQMSDDPTGIVSQGILYPPIRVREIPHQGTQDAGVVIVELGKGREFRQHGASHSGVEVPSGVVQNPQTVMTTISESTSALRIPSMAIRVPVRPLGQVVQAPW